MKLPYRILGLHFSGSGLDDLDVVPVFPELASGGSVF